MPAFTADMPAMPEALAELAARHAVSAGGAILPRVTLYVAHETNRPTPTLYRPMLCIVLRGAKRVMIGDRTLRYDADSYFIGSVDVPASGCVIEASPDAPYVAASLAIDPECLAELIVDGPGGGEGETAGFAVSPMTPELLDAWGRMLRLLDRPDEIATLAPMIEREILFRLLRGPQGPLLRQAARTDSRMAHVRQAIAHLRDRFDQPLRIEVLAEIAGMSAATFHRHFRAATAMSPLQYQKALRLQEARRRLVADADAARAAYAVGYESASQFSREYTRMFGSPPARDAARLRQSGEVAELVD